MHEVGTRLGALGEAATEAQALKSLKERKSGCLRLPRKPLSPLGQ